MAYERRKACLWHGFNALDDQSKGTVAKSRLKVLTHNVATCLGVQKAEEALQDYSQLNDISFLDYVDFLKVEVFNHLQHANQPIPMGDWDKMDEISWMLYSKNILSREYKVLSNDDTLKLWRVFNSAADLDTDGTVVYPVVMDVEEVVYIVKQFLVAAGSQYETLTEYEALSEGALHYSFEQVLNLIETRCCQGLDAYVISSAIQQLCQENVYDIVKKGHLMKRGHILTNWKERWFVLTSRNLRYYTSHGEKDMKGELLLKSCTKIEVLPDKSGCKPNRFQLVGESKSYEISCPDLRSRNEWLTALKNTMENSANPLSLQQQALQKRRSSRDQKRALLGVEKEQRKQEMELMENTKQELKAEKEKMEETQQELEAEKQGREKAEARAQEEAALKEAEQRRRQELEELQQQLQTLLEEEKQAKRDEEIVRILQAKILEEEFGKRDYLEQLQKEQEEKLKEERKKREELENLKQQQEDLLMEERKKLEELEAAKLSADEQRQQLEEIRASHEQMLAEERNKRRELEELKSQQEESLEGEKQKLEQLEEERKAADQQLKEALSKLQDAEVAKKALQARVKEKEKPIGLARLIQPSAAPFVTHRGLGAFHTGGFKKALSLEKDDDNLKEGQNELNENTAKPAELGENGVGEE